MESMSVLERLSELLPALPPGLIEAWGQLVLFAVPVCLYLAAVVLPFVVLYGLIRAISAGGACWSAVPASRRGSPIF